MWARMLRSSRPTRLVCVMTARHFVALYSLPQAFVLQEAGCQNDTGVKAVKYEQGRETARVQRCSVRGDGSLWVATEIIIRRSRRASTLLPKAAARRAVPTMSEAALSISYPTNGAPHHITNYLAPISSSPPLIPSPTRIISTTSHPA
jgi:hypothetical protein